MSEIHTHYTQSEEYATFMQKVGWQVIPYEHFVYKRKVPLLGSIIKVPRTPLKIDYQKLDILAKKNKALLVKIEPHFVLENNDKEKALRFLKDQKFSLDNFPICQTKTILVDLTQKEEQFLKSLRSETRHHLRKSWKQNLLMEIISNDSSPKAEKILTKFYTLFEKCAKERNFYSPFEKQMKDLWESFKQKATIILIYEKDNPEPLSGTLVLTYKNTAYYKYGASIPHGRKKYSSYFLFWEMFKWAHQRNLKTFDLEGIYDPRYKRTKKYKGFTQFKRGWSKNERTYLGSFSKHYSLPVKFISKIGQLI